MLVSMSSELRRRIPWTRPGAAAATTEEIPLIESGSASVLEGVEGAEGIELSELGASAAFASVEEAGAALDATGVGAPIGVTIGILAAIGFGAYEIYEHLVKKDPKITHGKVSTIYEKARLNPEIHIDNAKKFLDLHQQIQTQGKLDIIPLEYQQDDQFDVVSLENQHQFTLPFTKYTGPGNPLNNGEPVNRADAESQIHDHAYAEAKDKYDIFEADKEYLRHQSNIIAEGLSGKATLGESITAAIGSVGIGGKHLVEKHLDKTLYPSSFSGKQWHHLIVNLPILDTKNGILDLVNLIDNESIMNLNTRIYLQTNHLLQEVKNELLQQIVQDL